MNDTVLFSFSHTDNLMKDSDISFADRAEFLKSNVDLIHNNKAYYKAIDVNNYINSTKKGLN